MKDRLSWDDVYLLLDEVKAMARGILRHEREGSLQTTALVVSALRIITGEKVNQNHR